ncbi:hypothetical protein EXIGLDRAFT_772708 [Exidia glandulosa HHB12029]|uniref:Malate dehydrogenase n=1 Tax=Exidia glandulosa HHB12029 TaxID=1314781 RepID=A0A165F5U2_EXIGL|nr:hypothetical protein EXIGLDRAFT_772708 [Exidia glandulosa HHB12029]
MGAPTTSTPLYQNIHFNCGVQDVVPSLPAGQTMLTVPNDAKPRFITAGVGVQNYTCSDKGTYTSVHWRGRISLRRLLPRTQHAHLPHIQDILFTSTSLSASPSSASQSILNVLLLDAVLKIGDHYFSSINGTLTPVFDFTNSLEDKTQFVASKKTGNVKSPDGNENVDWLELKTVDGSLAKYTFRLDTKAGQPPASCTPGTSDISVPYAAQYWFYN